MEVGLAGVWGLSIGSSFLCPVGLMGVLGGGGARQATLDDGWSEQLVRDACTAAVVLCGHDRMHFRPEHEMNQHKITVGVHVHQLRAAEVHYLEPA